MARTGEGEEGGGQGTEASLIKGTLCSWSVGVESSSCNICVQVCGG